VRDNHVMADDWQRAAEIEWEDFFRAVEGRELRPLFAEAIPYLPTATAAEPPLIAVDLGCGDGAETLELLRRGWTVFAVDGSSAGIARLRHSVSPADLPRLTTLVAPFTEMSLPLADLVYAGLSLPFCDPRDFDAVWETVATAIRPNGFFVGHFFGPHDTWADKPDMTFHAREDVEALLSGFEMVQLREQDEDGASVGGPKHWHVFHVIARKVA
jgi:SAM-dependent methyltransferase